MSYTHLTKDGRHQVHGMLKVEYSLRGIAQALGRYASRISCEIQ